MIALLLSVAALLPGPATWAEGESAADLIEAARAKAGAGDRDAADKLYLEAVRTHPDDPEPLMALAEHYEDTERAEAALELYGFILRKVDTRHEAAADKLHRIFYKGRFPRQINHEYLGLGPVEMVVDTCRLADQFHLSDDPQRLFAYTTSLLFPEALTRGKAAPWIRLPGTSGEPGNLMYNRVSYGLIADPGNKLLRTRWQLGYPSSTILLSGLDYADLAHRVLHLLLRGHAYAQEYLGLDRRPDQGDLLKAFLTEEGPTGAAQTGDAIFFFDCDHAREPIEFARQVFHELGHLLLPRIGPFEGNDRWSGGAVGERLFFQWLLEEAGAVTQTAWPSDEAGEALEGLCGMDRAAAQQYLLQSCRLPLNAWLGTEPESFAGEDGADRFAGFCLWVQAAHGREALAGILHQAAETTPDGVLQQYRRSVADALSAGNVVRMDAGALNLVQSKLAQPPSEGALRRELVALGLDGVAAYRVFLPAGEWEMAVEHGAGDAGAFNVSLDGQAKFVGNVRENVSLGHVAEGWHDLRLVCGAEGPAEIISLNFRKPPEAGADEG